MGAYVSEADTVNLRKELISTAFPKTDIWEKDRGGRNKKFSGVFRRTFKYFVLGAPRSRQMPQKGGNESHARFISINSISVSMGAVLSRRSVLFLQAQLYGQTCRIQTQPLHSRFLAQYAISKQAVEGIVGDKEVTL